MSAELTVLARRLDRISEQHRYTRDFTLNSLQRGAVGGHRLLPRLPHLHPARRRLRRRSGPAAIEAAIRAAKRRNPVIDESLFDFVRGAAAAGAPRRACPSPAREARRDFVRRFQQLTGPVTAKGVEDTAFYRYFPLAALCEVGGDPSRIGMSVEEFHRRNAERPAQLPPRPVGHRHPRHQAGRGHARAPAGAVRGARAPGRRRWRAGAS